MPQAALLQRYVGQGSSYTDCYCAVLPRAVSLAGFIGAFYSTRLFHAERLVLQIALRRPITQAELMAFACKDAAHFAVWEVEARAEDAVLLRDMSGHTRSYLAVSGTRVLFGSAVVAAAGAPLSALARASLPPHRLYSKLLLRAAVRALADQMPERHDAGG